ncbi:MAG TPA: pseudouridine synthase [Thermoanaerobaculia bacterium]|nr:pseudouridine synthase [Thermoanaerobaculia bacterium]
MPHRPIKTLERVLSKAGLGSRTEARRWIAAGRVRVNDAVIRDPDQWIDLEQDRVAFDDEPLPALERVYLLFHKPAGYLATRHDKKGRPTIYDLLPDRDRYLLYVGRLDLDTSGLLILTNDSAFAERMTNPKYEVPKSYLVETTASLSEPQLDQLRRGVVLRDGPTRPAIVNPTADASTHTFEMTITEGRNRQVRRMVDAVGSEVLRLVRVAIGPITIGDLPSGTFRELTPAEVASLSSIAERGSQPS